MKNIIVKPRLLIAILFALVVGISVGAVSAWLITKNYYEKQEFAIVESLDDEFWNNGKITGDNTTAPQVTEAETTKEKLTTKPQAAEQKSTTQRVTAPYQGHKFVLNTSSKKIHMPDCDAVKTIAPSNYSETDDFVGVLASGYTQCKQCYPIDR